MKAADTKQTTTTATAKASTPFFQKVQGNAMSAETDHAPDTEAFFSRAPAVQAKPDTPPTSPTTPTTAPTSTAAASPTTTATPAAATPAPTPVRVKSNEVLALEAEAMADATTIRDILDDHSVWISEGEQEPIMAILRKYVGKPQPYSTRLSPFDFLILAMNNRTFSVGTFVSQTTNVFDQLMHRMSDDNIAAFKWFMHTFAHVFKDEKANEEVSFEIKKEHLLQGLEMAADIAEAAGELALAGVTGGTAELAILAKWLIDIIPTIYKSAKTISGLIDAIGNFNVDDISKLFSAGGVGNLVTRALFGDIPHLPVPALGEKEDGKKFADERGEHGFINVLNRVKNIITGLVRAYGEFAGFMNKALSTLDLTNKDWFDTFCMAYATAVHAFQAAMEPGHAIDQATGALREMTLTFFENIKGQLGKVVGGIKKELEFVTNPRALVKAITNKAVEWVLNFAITYPPSPLFKLVTKVISRATGKTIIEFIREKISFADDIINDIADSDIVQQFVSPLNKPVEAISGVVDSITGRVGSFVGDMETRVLGFMGNGTDFVTQLAGHKQTTAGKGAGNSPATGATDNKDGALATIKSGLHTGLMSRGDRLLHDKGTAIGKAAADKGKNIALEWWNKIHTFTSADHQKHSLYWKGRGRNTQLIVATTPMPVKQVLAEMAGKPEVKDTANSHYLAFKTANELVAQAETLVQTVQQPGGYGDKQIDLLNKLLVDLSNQMKILIPLISSGPPPSFAENITIGTIVSMRFKKTWVKWKITGRRTITSHGDPMIILSMTKTSPNHNDGDNGTRTLSALIADIYAGNAYTGADSKREEYVGVVSTSVKASIGKKVTERMLKDGRYKKNTPPKEDLFLDRPTDRWIPRSKGELGHVVNAVTWWNSNGRFFNPQSPEGKKFMEDPDNYEWEEASSNRSRGALLDEAYLPPVNINR